MRRAVLRVIISVVGLLLALPVDHPQAQSGGCFATVSPTSIDANSGTDFQFEIVSAQSEDILWIRITRPSSSYQVLNGAAYGGWEASQSESAITYTNATLEYGQSNSFAVSAQAGSTPTGAESWTVQASINEDGSDPFSCSGTLGAQITGGSTPTPTTAPTNNPTATPTPTTATSSSSTSTTTVVIQTVVTATPTRGPTPTPTPVPDRTPPIVTLEPLKGMVHSTPPQFSGTATDPAGVAGAEFSYDSGRNWQPVEITKETGTSVSYTFTPPDLPDGNYQVLARAKDAKGNQGTSKTITLVIDHLPPQLGGTLLSMGTNVLSPNDSSTYLAPVNSVISVRAASIGGATTVSLDIVDGNSRTSIPMTKSRGSSMWTTTLMRQTAGQVSLELISRDGAGRETIQSAGSLAVVSPARVQVPEKAISGATVTVHTKVPDAIGFTPWDATAYGSVNPLALTSSGEFGLYLPVGTYYLEIKAPGYQTAVSELFTVTHPGFVSTSLALVPARSLQIGGYTITLPDYRASTFPVVLEQGSGPGASELLGTSFPKQTLTTTGGQRLVLPPSNQPALISVLSSWHPSTSEQLAHLANLAKESDNHSIPIISQETTAKAAVFQLRGKYGIDPVVDSDGQVLTALKSAITPVFVFVNAQGVIERVAYGPQTLDELKQLAGIK